MDSTLVLCTLSIHTRENFHICVLVVWDIEFNKIDSFQAFRIARFPLDSIMYDSMGFACNQARQPPYVY